MAAGDGNGWVTCSFGHRHWGRFGAAGLLLLRSVPQAEVLMQLRAGWTHEGGRWALPGGARDSHESLGQAALREAQEEAGIDPGLVRVITTAMGADHVTWSYTYVLAVAGRGVQVSAMTNESDALVWVALAEVMELPLHPGLAGAWESLRPAIASALDSPWPDASHQGPADAGTGLG
jgi:8-oxo-dGTP diphosphatase